MTLNLNNLKNILNKIPFEYIFLTFAIISAILVERSSFIYSPLIMIIICIFAAWKINAVKFSVCIIGTLLLMLCSFIRSSTPPGSLKEKLNDHPIHGKIVFEITDPLCCSLPDIKNGATTEIKIHSKY